jgi:hypothetical protein
MMTFSRTFFFELFFRPETAGGICRQQKEARGAEDKHRNRPKEHQEKGETNKEQERRKEKERANKEREKLTMIAGKSQRSKECDALEWSCNRFLVIYLIGPKDGERKAPSSNWSFGCLPQRSTFLRETCCTDNSPRCASSSPLPWCSFC